jgi:predicted O-methyltransferase YrrM
MIAASGAVARPRYCFQAIRLGARELYRRYQEDRARVSEEDFSRLVPEAVEVKLADFECCDGNVAPYELLVIAGLVQYMAPRVLLEIGTFDGNTTLQMALNAPTDALVFTLDLPLGSSETALPRDRDDLTYVSDTRRVRPRFMRHPGVGNVIRLFGDSAAFDFRGALDGRSVDLAFIDGSHSYSYVKNDTERVLELLSPRGVILWHDYTPAWPGVWHYLNELRKDYPIVRIKGTTLGYFRHQL